MTVFTILLIIAMIFDLCFIAHHIAEENIGFVLGFLFALVLKIIALGQII